ncbi:MAG: hypothetical protein P4L16_03110, partial [Chlamydiales bacterium]|nr:hypothetical protein [Chlamydiales bacterium]
MTHTVAIQGEVLGRSEVMLRLRKIVDHNHGKEVWIGRNLEIMRTTWFDCLVWNIFAGFCGFEWCKNWYNVDYEKSRDSLLAIKQ